MHERKDNRRSEIRNVKDDTLVKEKKNEQKLGLLY